MSLNANDWKGLSIACFTVASLIGAWVAVFLDNRDNQLFISCGVLFSAGVLLAGGFVHLLNDSNETFLNLGYDTFQWAFLIAGELHFVTHMLFSVNTLNCISILTTVICLYFFVLSHDSFIGTIHVAGITIVLLTSTEMIVGRSLERVLVRRKNGIRGHSCVIKDSPIKDISEDASHCDGEPPETFYSNKEDGEAINSNQNKDESFDPIPAILLTVALGIHSFIEGIGIGNTPDISALESSFVAVLFHKGFTAFALAESLISSGFWEKGRRKWFFFSLGIFISIAIIGIGIGWAASPGAENATAATFVGITSGSFIFVAMHELIPEQMQRIDKENLPLTYPILSFWAGYGLMSMLALWA